jgi:hypothetical protein
VPDGEPGVEYDPDCKVLVEALRSKYRYTRQKTADGKLKDAPDKSHPWSDVVDADQYGTLFILSKHYDASQYVRANRAVTLNIEPHRPADRYAGY